MIHSLREQCGSSVRQHDCCLAYGFHEMKQGTRSKIDRSARREDLVHLSKLNHERYAEEVAQDEARGLSN